jgi:hypothetical protein
VALNRRQNAPTAACGRSRPWQSYVGRRGECINLWTLRLSEGLSRDTASLNFVCARRPVRRPAARRPSDRLATSRTGTSRTQTGLLVRRPRASDSATPRGAWRATGYRRPRPPALAIPLPACGQSRQRRTLAQHGRSGLRAVGGGHRELSGGEQPTADASAASTSASPSARMRNVALCARRPCDARWNKSD